MVRMWTNDVVVCLPQTESPPFFQARGRGSGGLGSKGCLAAVGTPSPVQIQPASAWLKQSSQPESAVEGAASGLPGRIQEIHGSVKDKSIYAPSWTPRARHQ
jgi:hypothetical protein